MYQHIVKINIISFISFKVHVIIRMQFIKYLEILYLGDQDKQEGAC